MNGIKEIYTDQSAGKTTIKYRGREISINTNLLDTFKTLSGRDLSTASIDQYLLNETDKTNLDPFNLDLDIISDNFSVSEIERHVEDYLKFEIELRGDTGIFYTL